MQGDYTSSRDSVHGSDSVISQVSPASGAPPSSGTTATLHPGTPPPGDQAPPPFTPPPTFDDPDLLAFQRHDGPYLDLFTDRVYYTLMRCVDPETGWAFPPNEDLTVLSKLKPTALRKHINILCDELGKFTKVERKSKEKGRLPNAYFLNAWTTGLVPSPMNEPSEDPLGEARRIIAQQKIDALRVEKDYEIEARELYIEQLKAQLEAAGVPPVSPSEPTSPPRANPPPPSTT